MICSQAIAELLDEENVQIPSWVCFSSVDGENASSGESFQECLDVLNKSDKISIVGINCSSPQLIENLILKFRKVTGTPAITSSLPYDDFFSSLFYITC